MRPQKEGQVRPQSLINKELLMKLKIGDKAPDFKLRSHLEKEVALGDLRAFTDYMKQIPIPKANEIGTIEEIYNSVLAAKCANFAADTSNLEAEIDRLVYGLYGLTEEEIKIVEGK